MTARDEAHAEGGGRPDEAGPRPATGEPGVSGDPTGPVAQVDRILAALPERDPARKLLYRLRREILEREVSLQEARRSLLELETALEKVTAPANRIGVYLGSAAPGAATILVGGTEYYANLDPRVDPTRLRLGCRVLINEAYAVVGDLGAAPAGAVARVVEVLEPARLRVAAGQGSQETVVERGADLAGRTLRVGDEVRLDPSSRVALELLPGRQGRDYLLETIPEMPWSAIGGQDEAIRAIRDAIELPALHPELFARFGYGTPKGFLLHGPPGCGKTMIGKATAWNLVQHLRTQGGTEVREYFLHVKGPEILNMWLGESERLVRELFAQARQKRREGYLPFVFIDEAESVLGTRRSMRSHYIANTLVPMFCAEMDGIESLRDLVVILASNRHDLIDPAILRPGRIDRKIKVRRPDRAGAREVLAIHLTAGVPIDAGELARCGDDPEVARQGLIDAALEELFSRADQARFLEVGLRSGRRETLYRADLVSGAILAAVVQRAKELAIRRALTRDDGEAGLRGDDLQAAVVAEFSESEIFPPTDSAEEWLRLLDIDPENVVRVSPVQRGARGGAGTVGQVV